MCFKETDEVKEKDSVKPVNEGEKAKNEKQDILKDNDNVKEEVVGQDQKKLEGLDDNEKVKEQEKVDKKDKETEIKELKEELNKKAKEAEEYLNMAKRIQAEFDNFRKRTIKEKESLVKYANEDLILAVLPVLDNLERAAASVEVNDSTKAVIDGVNMIMNQFRSVLEKFNVKEIEAEGKQFDPNKHHAVMQVEDKDKESGIVVEVLQKGYQLQDRVIRPSLVKVTK